LKSRKPKGFYTKGKGVNRKVIPITEPSGHSIKHSRAVHPSRDEAYERHIQREEGSRRKSFEHYKITFYYKGGKQETVNVAARDSDDALNLALKNRKTKLKPRSIAIKDGVGEVLAKIATGFGKVHAGVSQVKRGYTRGKVAALVKEAQSEDPATRAIARKELKKNYPDVYNNIAFEQV